MSNPTSCDRLIDVDGYPKITHEMERSGAAKIEMFMAEFDPRLASLSPMTDALAREVFRAMWELCPRT